VVPLRIFSPRLWFVVGVSVVLAACATGPQITRTQDVPESADTPYKKILVVALFSSFDSRRYLEDEVVKHLAQLGVDGVASTSMMDTKTPMVKETFLAMIEKINADALLVTHLESLDTTGKVKGMRPEATYNLRPTYYYNVFSVDLQEYREPQAVDMTHSLSLLSELYSVQSRDSVWAIESNSKITQKHDVVRDYSIYVDEASAIVDFMAKDGLIAH
jgi:hypothetical protein